MFDKEITDITDTIFRKKLLSKFGKFSGKHQQLVHFKNNAIKILL